MSKKIRFQSQRQEEFSKLLLSLCQSKSVWEVWADFITLSACTISNLAGKDAPSYAEREAERLKHRNQSRIPKKGTQNQAPCESGLK